MKKLYTIFLMLLCLLYLFTGCSQSKGTNNTKSPETCLEHVGNIVCENCGLNYYDELKSLIIKNGRSGATSSLRVYDAYTHANDDNDYFIYVCVTYDYATSAIKLMAQNEFISTSSTRTYYFIITIPHPTESDSIKDGKYTWEFSYISSLYEEYAMLGILNANIYSDIYTNSLTETVNSGADSSLSHYRSMAAYCAKDAICYGLCEILDLGDKGVTAKNFGFTNLSSLCY